MSQSGFARDLRTTAKGTAFLGGAQAVGRLINIALLPIVARYLGPADYGRFGYALAITSLLVSVLQLGFPGAQARLYYDVNHSSTRTGSLLLSLNLFISSLAVGVCLILVVAGPHLYTMLGPHGDLPFFPLVATAIWAVPVAVVRSMMLAHYLASKRFGLGALVHVLKASLTAGGALILVVTLRKGAAGRLLAVLLADSLVLLLAGWPYFSSMRGRIKRKPIRDALAFGAPLTFHSLALVVHEFADRAILAKYMSMTEVGYYSVAYTVGLVLSTLVVTLNKAWKPSYYRFCQTATLEQRRHRVERFLSLWLMVVGFIAVALSHFAGPFVVLLAGEDYKPASKLIPLLALAYFMQGLYHFGMAPLMQRKRTRIIPLVTTAAAIVNVVLNLLLIPILGAWGAAWTTVVSFTLMAVLANTVSLPFSDVRIFSLPSGILIAIVTLLTLLPSVVRVPPAPAAAIPICYLVSALLLQGRENRKALASRVLSTLRANKLSF